MDNRKSIGDSIYFCITRTWTCMSATAGLCLLSTGYLVTQIISNPFLIIFAVVFALALLGGVSFLIIKVFNGRGSLPSGLVSQGSNISSGYSPSRYRPGGRPPY